MRQKCIEACEKGCIDFDMQDTLHEIHIGAIIVTTGMSVYDPTPLDEYGYRRFANVVTSIEFERLIATGGPLGVNFGRPGDLQRPRQSLLLQYLLYEHR